MHHVGGLAGCIQWIRNFGEDQRRSRQLVSGRKLCSIIIISVRCNPECDAPSQADPVSGRHGRLTGSLWVDLLMPTVSSRKYGLECPSGKRPGMEKKGKLVSLQNHWRYQRVRMTKKQFEKNNNKI